MGFESSLLMNLILRSLAMQMSPADASANHKIMREGPDFVRRAIQSDFIVHGRRESIPQAKGDNADSVNQYMAEQTRTCMRVFFQRDFFRRDFFKGNIHK